MNQEIKDEIIIRCKTHRKAIDPIIQDVRETIEVLQKEKSKAGAEATLSLRSLQLGVMWLGMVMKELDVPTPYPNSYDPSNAKVDPTADNLKL